MIVEKMKNQFHSKGIDSLDKVYVEISKFDTENKGFVDNIYFENFLAKLGVFLKTQEISELYKYLLTGNGEVKYENFINVLKTDIPENIVGNIVKIFDYIKDREESISIDALKQKFCANYHPRVKLMLKDKNTINNEFEFSILFVSGEKGYLDIGEFIELHRNMYWVTPKENITNFKSMINEVWGYKD